MDAEMVKALEADGEKLRQLTGEDHGPEFPAEPAPDYLEGGTFEWCAVEIFGHRSHVGRGREEDRFGSKMLRIDVPIKGDPANGWETYYYSGGSIFSYRLTDEATVRRLNKPYAPPSRVALLEHHDDEGEADEGEY